MEKKLLKNGLVCGIVLLFVLVSIVPSIGSRSIRDNHTINFTIQPPDIVFGELEVSQGVFTSLELPGCGFSTVVGEAKLPLIRKTFQIPQGAVPELEITSLSWETFSLSSKGLPRYIIPVQPSVRKIPGEKQTADFVFNPQHYSQNRFTPSEIASIAEEGEIRGHRFILVEVAPVQYNPVTGEIRILKSCDIRIDLPGSDLTLTNTLTRRYHSRSFDQLFQRIFDNYGQFGMQAKNTEGYLIVVYDSFYEETLPLANSKQTMGYEVTITKTSQIPGGPTKENIAAYIADAYTTWSIPPAFVLLVGDVPQIPTWTGFSSWSATDLYYVTVTAGNYFPDLFIGRFPAATAAQVSIMVQKTVDFEQQLLPSYDFLKKTTFIASSDFGQLSEHTHNYVIHTFLEPNNYSYDKIYQASGGTTSQIINAINDGRILVVYGGHGYPGGWECIPFNQNNIRFDLTNVDMYPFVCSFACTTNPFNQAECFGETWLREENKGALAFWGSSTYSYWYEDDILEKGMFEAWWQDGLRFLGGMTDEALFRVWQNYSGGGLSRYYYEAYNLLGDPSVDITGSYEPHDYYRDLTSFPHYISRIDTGAMVMKLMLDFLRWNRTTHPEGPPNMYSEQDLYDFYRDYIVIPELYFDDDRVIDEYELAFGLNNEIRTTFPVPPEYPYGGTGYYGYFFSAAARETALDALKWACTWIDYPVDYYNDIRYNPVPQPGHTNHVPVAVPTGGNYDNWMVIRGIHTSGPAWPYGSEFNIYGFWINDPSPGGIGDNWYMTVQYFMDNYFDAMTVGLNEGMYVVVVDPPQVGLSVEEMEAAVARSTIGLAEQVSASPSELRLVRLASRVGFSGAAHSVIVDLASQALSGVYPSVVAVADGVETDGSGYKVSFNGGSIWVFLDGSLRFTKLWSA